MDVFTLFAANAIVLLVMAGGFLAAWAGRRSETCWISWMAANSVLAAALLLFMFLPPTAMENALPHALLVLGFGLRWRAARLFTGHACPWLPIAVLTGAVAALFILPIGERGAFAGANIILASQAIVIAWHFHAHCRQATWSRPGLVLAYGLMALSFAVRAGHGLLSDGAFASYLPHDVMLELHLLVAVVHSAASGAFALSIAYERAEALLSRDRDRVAAEASSMSRLAKRDELTGLMNRRAVEPRFTGLQREGFRTVAVLDLDHFKAVNDCHGHGVGDAALRAAAGAMAPDEDCMAVRLGGEEFMLLLRGPAARERAEQRRQAIARRIAADVPGLDRIVTASMGLVELPRGGVAPVDFGALYAAADRLLYEAKEGGRNRMVAERIQLFPGPQLARTGTG